jgi:hypothetical protein
VSPEFPLRARHRSHDGILALLCRSAAESKPPEHVILMMFMRSRESRWTRTPTRFATTPPRCRNFFRMLSPARTVHRVLALTSLRRVTFSTKAGCSVRLELEVTYRRGRLKAIKPNT